MNDAPQLQRPVAAVESGGPPAQPPARGMAVDSRCGDLGSIGDAAMPAAAQSSASHGGTKRTAQDMHMPSFAGADFHDDPGGHTALEYLELSCGLLGHNLAPIRPRSGLPAPPIWAERQPTSWCDFTRAREIWPLNIMHDDDEGYIIAKCYGFVGGSDQHWIEAKLAPVKISRVLWGHPPAQFNLVEAWTQVTPLPRFPLPGQKQALVEAMAIATGDWTDRELLMSLPLIKRALGDIRAEMRAAPAAAAAPSGVITVGSLHLWPASSRPPHLADHSAGHAAVAGPHAGAPEPKESGHAAEVEAATEIDESENQVKLPVIDNPVPDFPLRPNTMVRLGLVVHHQVGGTPVVDLQLLGVHGGEEVEVWARVTSAIYSTSPPERRPAEELAVPRAHR